MQSSILQKIGDNISQILRVPLMFFAIASMASMTTNPRQSNSRKK